MRDKDLDEMILQAISEDIDPSNKLIEDTKKAVRGIGRRKRKKDYILISILTILSSVLFLAQTTLILYKLDLSIFQLILIYSFYGFTINGLLVVIYYHRKNFVKFLS